uniref:Small monomeric GTPase n=1 Tax=Branchiostoma floridae TaxID=7739 RepID=C3YK58_BRAFL|eukprot:XP_002603504.1 hypothetical protein BRAFLDRAFT_79041 [Branchiostoma floridae]
MREYKVVVLGSGGVGKSALTVQFVTGQFMEKYDPPIEDFYRKEIETLFSKNGQGFYLGSSLTTYQTFQDIKPIRDQIIGVKGTEKVPLVLVGNKVDLESEREVPTSEGKALAQSWGVPFLETSAKSKHNVDDVFAEVVREMNFVQLPDQKDACCTCVIV